MTTINAGDGGIGSAAFGRLGAMHAPVWPWLRGKAGAGADAPLVVASFSAGWGLVGAGLAGDPDGEPLAIVLADSYYQARTASEPKRAFRAYAEAAARGERMLLISTSHVGGPGYTSSHDAVTMLVEGLGLLPDEGLASLLDGAGDGLGSARSVGGLAWIDYPAAELKPLGSQHVQHATTVGPALVRRVVLPWIDRITTGGPGPCAGAGLVLGALALTWWGLR